MKKFSKSMFLAFIMVMLCFVLVITVSSASYGNKTDNRTLTIYDDSGGSEGAELFIGESLNLIAIIRPENTKNIDVTWSSSNENVARVKNGVVTTFNKGTVDIIATSSGIKSIYKLTVVDENSTYEYNGTTYNYVWEKGTWGNNIKWYLCVGNRLIITGKGDMQEPPGHVSQIPWLSLDSLSSIEIQEGITSICTYAFGAMEAWEIKIPSTVTKIGRNAFYCFRSQTNFQDWYFGGTPAQWNNIDIGLYNDGLPSVPDEYCRASGHIYKVTSTTQPTCTLSGYTNYTCECGDGYTANRVDAIGHYYTSEITTPATHLKEGVETFNCHCGDSYTKSIAKLEGHTYSSNVTKKPTHLKEGETTFTCECGDSYTEAITKLEGHTYTSEVTKEPTHLKEGETTFTCECGDSYTEPIAKLEGHTHTSKVTKESTHLEEGEMTFTCECGDNYTETIEKLKEHTYEKEITAPTCTKQGYTTFTCACGDSYVGDYVNEKGHSYSSNTVQPTCTKSGAVTTFCTNCGDTYTETIEPTGHNFDGSKCKNCDFDKSDDCSCSCHKNGIAKFFFNFILFFQKIFKTNKTCSCGVAHY